MGRKLVICLKAFVCVLLAMGCLLPLYQRHNMRTALQPLVQEHVGNRTSYFNSRARNKTLNPFIGVQKFVFFVGYSRSGSTIIGSILDAHPNIIIANENKFFMNWWTYHNGPINKDFLFAALCADSRTASNNARRPSHVLRKGYSIGVDSPWQGSYTDLLVIGNKRAEKLTTLFVDNPTKMKERYNHLIDSIKIPIHIIHVVRNPFDMIASRMYYASRIAYPHTLLHKKINKLKNETLMLTEVERLLKLANAVEQMEEEFKFRILHIHIEDLINEPSSVVERLCNYLEVPCPGWYMKVCANVAFSNISKTRDLVEWTPQIVEEVMYKKDIFHFFVRYNITSDFH